MGIMLSFMQFQIGSILRERRIQYQWNLLLKAIRKRIEIEKDIWDDWARHRLGKPRKVAVNFTQWLRSSRVYQRIVREFPALMNIEGWRVLDIGGTCVDSIKVLRFGVQRLDQVEISPISQQVAIANLEESGVEWKQRVVFHTIPAEMLPFQDFTFDLVFSRATIHHTKRPNSFHEIHRVLKDGGYMFLIEPMMSSLLLKIMYKKREYFHQSRGTDLPLTPDEIEGLASLFQRVDYHRFGTISSLWNMTLGKLALFKAVTRYVWTFDGMLDDYGGLAR
jgi:ubiquinone/menaquinone biosynthesis C-methylase UbiE